MIRTDHHSLTFLLSQSNPRGRLLWLADGLSRCDEHDVSSPSDVAHFIRYCSQDGLLYFAPARVRQSAADRRRPYEASLVPHDKDIRDTLIAYYHESTTAIQRSYETTYYRLRRRFHWRTLRKDLERFCRSYHDCQISKPSNQLRHGLLQSLPYPRRRGRQSPWISSQASRHRPSIVTMQFLSRWIVSHSLCDSFSAIKLAPPLNSLVLSSWIMWFTLLACLHIVLAIVVPLLSLRISAVSLSTLQRIVNSTAHLPQTDGQTERVNNSQSTQNYLPLQT